MDFRRIVVILARYRLISSFEEINMRTKPIPRAEAKERAKRNKQHSEALIEMTQSVAGVAFGYAIFSEKRARAMPPPEETTRFQPDCAPNLASFLSSLNPPIRAQFRICGPLSMGLCWTTSGCAIPQKLLKGRPRVDPPEREKPRSCEEYGTKRRRHRLRPSSVCRFLSSRIATLDRALQKPIRKDNPLPVVVFSCMVAQRS